MTKERYNEIKQRIEKLQDLMWSIDLIDHWTRQDREEYDKYLKELLELKEAIVNEVFED